MHTNLIYILYWILLEIKHKKEAEYNLKGWTPDNSFTEGEVVSKIRKKMIIKNLKFKSLLV